MGRVVRRWESARRVPRHLEPRLAIRGSTVRVGRRESTGGLSRSGGDGGALGVTVGRAGLGGRPRVVRRKAVRHVAKVGVVEAFLGGETGHGLEPQEIGNAIDQLERDGGGVKERGQVAGSHLPSSSMIS